MPSQKTNKSGIHLPALLLNATLGWPEEERLQPQPIIINITIQFDTPPSACFNDTLENTVCYDTLVKIIKKIVAAKAFRLLEHISYEIYQAIKQTISQPNKIHVSVKKQPPIPELTGGAIFYFGDDEDI
jgi:dihydroneopterin aldolase